MAGNLKLDSNHDIIIGRGATRVGGAEQVAQLCKCRLLALLGEWKHDATIGLPWFDGLLSKTIRPSDIQVTVANIVRTTPGVQQVIAVNVETNRTDRIVTINFIALSDYGEITELVSWQQ